MSTAAKRTVFAAVSAIALMTGGLGSANAFGHGGGGHAFGGFSGGHSFGGRSFSGAGSFSGGHAFVGRSIAGANFSGRHAFAGRSFSGFSGSRSFHTGFRHHRRFGRSAFLGGLAFAALAAAPYDYGYYPVFDDFGDDCYLVRRVVYNRWGDRVIRRVSVCY